MQKLPLAHCDRCPGKDAPLIAPEPARIKARLALVGEGPGRTEQEEGRPFSPNGPSGRLLMRGLRAIGVQRAECHITNAVPCPVREADMPAAREACAERLHAELVAAAAPVIVPLGAWALQSVLGRGSRPQIQRWRGSVNPTTIIPRQAANTAEASRSSADPVGCRLPEGGPSTQPAVGGSDPAPAAVLVCPSLHPAFVLRPEGRHWAPTLEKDFARIGRYLDGAPFVPPELQPGRKIEIPQRLDQLEAALARLASDHLAFDVETVGLGPTATSLVCFALSDGQLTIVVPWATRRDGEECWWAFGGKAAAELVSGAIARRVTITHNGPAFDHIVAARYGIRIAAWEDTLLATWALHSHMPRGLSACVQTHLDVTAWKEQEDRTADLDRLWIYNARDTLYTRLLWDILQTELCDGYSEAA